MVNFKSDEKNSERNIIFRKQRRHSDPRSSIQFLTPNSYAQPQPNPSLGKVHDQGVGRAPSQLFKSRIPWGEGQAALPDYRMLLPQSVKER